MSDISSLTDNWDGHSGGEVQSFLKSQLTQALSVSDSKIGYVEYEDSTIKFYTVEGGKLLNSIALTGSADTGEATGHDTYVSVSPEMDSDGYYHLWGFHTEADGEAYKEDSAANAGKLVWDATLPYKPISDAGELAREVLGLAAEETAQTLSAEEVGKVIDEVASGDTSNPNDDGEESLTDEEVNKVIGEVESGDTSNPYDDGDKSLTDEEVEETIGEADKV